MNRVRFDRFRIRCCLGLGALVVGGHTELPAQGTFNGTVLRSGGGQPSVTAVLPIPPFGSNPSELQLQFGFATDEIFGPGKFFDSLTITLQDDGARNTLVVATADASGVVWAPQTPGGLAIDPASITRTTIAFPSLQPVLANRIAYQVSVPIPAQFDGLSTKLYLDLFDNLNSVTSLGFAQITVVPEPVGLRLLVCAGLMWLIQLARRK